MKLTFDEFLDRVRSSSTVDVNDILTFELFIRKYRLANRFIGAVNKTYNKTDADFEADLMCAEKATLITCFIDWEIDPDNNWREVNVLYQEFKR